MRGTSLVVCLQCDKPLGDLPFLLFPQAVGSLVIMFVIQWVYTLINMCVAAIVYFYIGRASPGLHLGKQQSHFATTFLFLF